MRYKPGDSLLATVSLFHEAPKCFSSDSSVQLMDGRRLQIGQLRQGEKISAFDGSHLLFSEMILMLDRNPLTQGKVII